MSATAFQYSNGSRRRANSSSGASRPGSAFAATAYAASTTHATVMPWTTAADRGPTRRASAIAPANAAT